MYFRPAILILFALFVYASGTGCQKAGSRRPALPPTVQSPDTIAAVHWVGKRRLDLEADAYYFSRVWSLPETGRLQSQTFDRLSVGIWRVLRGEQVATQIPPAVLRPLFDDLLQEEAYLEIRAVTNSQPSTKNYQLTLAVHVTAQRAGLWETNMAIAVELLTGRPAIANTALHGWSLQLTNVPELITLTRVDDWTVVSVGPQPNPLSDEITARIRRDGVPFVSAGTNLWFEASLDLPRLAAISSFSAPWMGREGRGEVAHFFAINHQLSTLNNLSFSLSGDGANVLTHARLTFSEPLPAQLKPWNLPAELMHEPLTSFIAMRDVQPLLAGWKSLRNLQIGALPDQLYLWSLAGSPYQIYLAAPLPDAKSQVAALTDHLLQYGNPWLATNGYISFDRAADGNGVTWGNLPDIKPFIRAAGNGAGGWLFAGLFPDTNNAATPPPAGMIQDVLRRTNLVYYDWEVTGQRLQPCLLVGQTARQIVRRTPLPMDSASLSWLAVLVPRLGTSATIINRTGPTELTFYRRSTLGLTATELNFLADWLESPEFPR